MRRRLGWRRLALLKGAPTPPQPCFAPEAQLLRPQSEGTPLRAPHLLPLDARLTTVLRPAAWLSLHPSAAWSMSSAMHPGRVASRPSSAVLPGRAASHAGSAIRPGGGASHSGSAIRPDRASSYPDSAVHPGHAARYAGAHNNPRVVHSVRWPPILQPYKPQVTVHNCYPKVLHIAKLYIQFEGRRLHFESKAPTHLGAVQMAQHGAIEYIQEASSTAVTIRAYTRDPPRAQRAFEEPHRSRLAPATASVGGCRDRPHAQAAFNEPRRSRHAASPATVCGRRDVPHTRATFNEPHDSRLAPATDPVMGRREEPHTRAAFVEPHRTQLAAAPASAGGRPDPTATTAAIGGHAGPLVAATTMGGHPGIVGRDKHAAAVHPTYTNSPRPSKFATSRQDVRWSRDRPPPMPAHHQTTWSPPRHKQNRRKKGNQPQDRPLPRVVEPEVPVAHNPTRTSRSGSLLPSRHEDLSVTLHGESQMHSGGPAVGRDMPLSPSHGMRRRQPSPFTGGRQEPEHRENPHLSHQSMPAPLRHSPRPEGRNAPVYDATRGYGTREPVVDRSYSRFREDRTQEGFRPNHFEQFDRADTHYRTRAPRRIHVREPSPSTRARDHQSSPSGAGHRQEPQHGRADAHVTKFRHGSDQPPPRNLFKPENKPSQVYKVSAIAEPINRRSQMDICDDGFEHGVGFDRPHARVGASYDVNRNIRHRHPTGGSSHSHGHQPHATNVTYRHETQDAPRSSREGRRPDNLRESGRDRCREKSRETSGEHVLDRLGVFERHYQGEIAQNPRRDNGRDYALGSVRVLNRPGSFIPRFCNEESLEEGEIRETPRRHGRSEYEQQLQAPYLNAHATANSRQRQGTSDLRHLLGRRRTVQDSRGHGSRHFTRVQNVSEPMLNSSQSTGADPSSLPWVGIDIPPQKRSYDDEYTESESCYSRLSRGRNKRKTETRQLSERLGNEKLDKKRKKTDIPKDDDSGAGDFAVDKFSDLDKEADGTLNYIQLLGTAMSRHRLQFIDRIDSFKGATKQAGSGSAQHTHELKVTARNEDRSIREVLQVEGHGRNKMIAKQNASRKMLKKMLEINPNLSYRSGEKKGKKKGIDVALTNSGKNHVQVLNEIMSIAPKLFEDEQPTFEHVERQAKTPTHQNRYVGTGWQVNCSVKVRTPTGIVTVTGSSTCAKKKDGEKLSAGEVLDKLRDEHKSDELAKALEKVEEPKDTANDDDSDGGYVEVSDEKPDPEIYDTEVSRRFKTDGDKFDLPEDYKVTYVTRLEELEVFVKELEAEDTVTLMDKEYREVGVYVELDKLHNELNAPPAMNRKDGSVLAVAGMKGAIVCQRSSFSDADWPPPAISRILTEKQWSKAAVLPFDGNVGFKLPRDAKHPTYNLEDIKSKCFNTFSDEVNLQNGKEFRIRIPLPELVSVLLGKKLEDAYDGPADVDCRLRPAALVAVASKLLLHKCNIRNEYELDNRDVPELEMSLRELFKGFYTYPSDEEE